MNWLKFLVALSAIVVAGCAAYFSVTGLGVLFSGASISVMIMAGALEFAKLVAATYLKQAWDSIGVFLKYYFVIAVTILMIITSAGIFGYLSNAFQQQNLAIQQVDREIALWTSKVESNQQQIKTINEQLTNLQQNQGKIIDLQRGNSTNGRLLRSVDTRDKQILDISSKLDKLNIEINQYNDSINNIKTENIEIEREVGGFRFVADSFGVDLNTVVKFFIFLIVFVFDPMAIALVIALNNIIKNESSKKSSDTVPIIQNIEPKLYELYGETDFSDKNEDISSDVAENIEENTIEVEQPASIAPKIEESTIEADYFEDIGEAPKEIQENLWSEGQEGNKGSEIPVDTMLNEVEMPKNDMLNNIGQEIDGFDDEPAEIITISNSNIDTNDDVDWLNPYNGGPYYTNPNFPWHIKKLWHNDHKAVQYWLTQKGGNAHSLDNS